MAFVSDQQTALDRMGETWFAENVRELWLQHILPLGPFHETVEIGVFSGMSLSWTAENLLGKNGVAHGIDNWQPHRRGREAWDVAQKAKMDAFLLEAEFNRSPLDGRKIALHEQTSISWLTEKATHCEWRADLIYVDGAHDAPAALTDICLSWQILKEGGVLVQDDVDLRAGRRLRQGPLSGEAMDAFLVCFAGRYRVLYKTAKQLAVIKEA